MRAPYSLLRQCAPDLPAVDELAHQLSMGGLEVDEVQLAAPKFSGLVVAKVLTVAPIAGSRGGLKRCEVDTGKRGRYQVVCGAPEVLPDALYVLALPGAVLPGGMKIVERELAGTLSEGMLCSESEMGLGEGSDGILQLPGNFMLGQCVREALQLDDLVLSLDLTPNRGDCFGVEGIARDAAALAGVDFTPLAQGAVPPQMKSEQSVEITAASACPRYFCRTITGMDAARPSPLWLKEKLRRFGVRSISPLVDITNCVMMELGQPLHAFDLSTVQGDICVRTAHNELLILLDQTRVELVAGKDLVIADSTQPLALAGIMGSAASGVVPQTTDVLLESAFFTPQGIASSARRHGLTTEASRRYERGICPLMQERALERATEMVLAICGGQPGPISGQEHPAELPRRPLISLAHSRLNTLLGSEVDADALSGGFKRLGLAPKRNKDGWQLQVPAWRFDLQCAEDIVEEAARLIGYDHLPEAEPVRGSGSPVAATDATQAHFGRELLVAQGWAEAINYSFGDSRIQQQVLPAGQSAVVELERPLAANQAVMRTSLIPGLLQTLRHNLSHRQHRIKLFEHGQCFRHTAGGIDQGEYLAALMHGPRYSLSWAQSPTASHDFYDAKGVLEVMLAAGGLTCDFVRPEEAMSKQLPDWLHDWFSTEAEVLHPGRCALVRAANAQGQGKGHMVGFVACLHPRLAARFGAASHEVVCFEIRLSDLPLSPPTAPVFQPFSRLPKIRRDLSLLVPAEVKAQTLLEVARHSGGKHLLSCRIFDVHRSDEGQSLAIAFEWQPDDENWTAQQLEKIVSTVLKQLEKLGVSLRE